MKNKILFFIILAGVLITSLLPFISARLGTFKQNECVEIKAILNADWVYISTINYPNLTIAESNIEMNKTGQTFIYEFCNTSKLGTYIYDFYDSNEDVYVNDFEITPSGFSISDSQGMLSFGLIISIMLISGLFMFIGYKFSEKDKTFPVGLFFIVISLLLSVYTLHLGYIYSRDVLYPLGGEKTQYSVYFGIMWGLIGIIFISMLFLMIKTIKEIKERKSVQKYGEGWNTKTNQYDFYR